MWEGGKAMVVFGGSGDYGIPLNDVWLLHMPVKEEEMIDGKDTLYISRYLMSISHTLSAGYVFAYVYG
jgi:hypothetical protein